MIVTCHACDTSFQLDETRVPIQGIRVRCSRCKEAFFLEHPSTSQSEALHEVAGEAAETGAVPPPDSTQDLPPSDVVEQDEEADWEFNHEPAAEETPSDTSDSLIADVGVGQGGSGLSLADDPEPEQQPALDAAEPEAIAEKAPAPAPAAKPVSDASDESAFGSVDDFSSLMEEDPDQQLDESIGLEDDSSLLDGIDVPSTEAGQYSGGGVTEELGEPENWNFFSDDSLEGGAARSAGAPSAAAIGRVALAPEGSLGETFEATSAGHDEDYDETSAAASKLHEIARYAGHTVGWGLTITLFGLGLVSGLWPTAQSMVETPQVIELQGVRIDSIRGSWVETARAGTLLEVTGVLHNRSRRPLELGELFQVALLSADGRRLDVTPAPAGTPLSESQVRELPKAELWSAQSRAAYALIRSPLKPGGQLPFQTLFADVPIQAVRFSIEQAPATLVQPAQVEGLSGVAPQDVEAELPIDGLAEGAPTDAGSTEAGAPSSPAHAPTDPGDELTWGE